MAQGVPGRLRPRIILTFRHHRGRLYPRRNLWYSFSVAESTSGHMVLSEGTTEKSPVIPLGIDPGTVRLVAQSLSHFATPGPIHIYIYIHSFSILSDDRSKASSKTMPPYSAIQSLLLQMRISSPVKVIL